MLIGLLGRAGAGKSTVTEHLVTAHRFEALAFAEPLKAGLGIMLEIEYELAAPEHKERPIDWLGVSPRELMQTLGTEWGRKMIHPDIWVRALERTVDYLEGIGTDTSRVVISDVRYTNEADWILSKGGVLWEVYGRAKDDVRPHDSEGGIPEHYPRRSIWNGHAWADTAQQIDQAIATELARDGLAA